MGYETDITLERKFAGIIRAILGNYFIRQDPVLDRQEATDFAIFTVKPFKVGVRLRRYSYLIQYPNEFTIRWSRPSGVDTEIDKIRRGAVDYILYGFVDQEEKRIVKYFIGDLATFRQAEPEPIDVFPNKPPDSKFAAFRLSDMPPTFVVKAWPDMVQDIGGSLLISHADMLFEPIHAEQHRLL